MFEVVKSGIHNDKVWLYGKCDLEILEIKGIFNTNLTSVPTDKKLKIKKVKISSSASKPIKYYVEF